MDSFFLYQDIDKLFFLKKVENICFNPQGYNESIYCLLIEKDLIPDLLFHFIFDGFFA